MLETSHQIKHLIWTPNWKWVHLYNTTKPVEISRTSSCLAVIFLSHSLFLNSSKACLQKSLIVLGPASDVALTSSSISLLIALASSCTASNSFTVDRCFLFQYVWLTCKFVSERLLIFLAISALFLMSLINLVSKIWLYTKRNNIQNYDNKSRVVINWNHPVSCVLSVLEFVLQIILEK